MDGLPGHKRVYARLRRAMPGNDDCVGLALARARLRGAQVCFCPFSVIVVQQLAAISLLDGPRPRRMNWPFRDSVCAVKRRAGAHVVLCKLLSGSGYRLRATRATGAFTGDRRPLPKFGIPLAEACSAGTSDGWRPGPRERSRRSHIGSAGRTIATCPVDYAKRAGELIARGARSLRSTLRQKNVSAAARAERSVR